MPVCAYGAFCGPDPFQYTKPWEWEDLTVTSYQTATTTMAKPQMVTITTLIPQQQTDGSWKTVTFVYGEQLRSRRHVGINN